MEKYLVIHRDAINGLQHSFIETQLPDSMDPADFELSSETEILAVVGVDTIEDSEGTPATIDMLDLWVGGAKVLPAG